MAFYVLGAPGSGKSTVRPELAARLPAWVVLDWDDLMDAASDLASADIRATPAVWPAYQRLVRAAVESVGPGRVVLFGVCTPDELDGWPIDQCVLLDCSDDERGRRLATRHRAGETEAAIRDAAAYRSLPLRVIDTSDLTPAEVAAAIAALVVRRG